MNFKPVFNKVYNSLEKFHQFLFGLTIGLLVFVEDRVIAREYFEIDSLIIFSIFFVVSLLFVFVSITKMVKKEIQNRKEGKVEKLSAIKLLSIAGMVTSFQLLRQILRKDFDISMLIFGIIFIASVIAFCINRWKEKRNIEINS